MTKKEQLAYRFAGRFLRLHLHHLHLYAGFSVFLLVAILLDDC